MHLASSCWGLHLWRRAELGKLHSLHGKPTAEHGQPGRRWDVSQACGGQRTGAEDLLPWWCFPAFSYFISKFCSQVLPHSCQVLILAINSLPLLVSRQEFSPCFHSWCFIICFFYMFHVFFLFLCFSITSVVFFLMSDTYIPVCLAILFPFLLLYIFGVIFIVVALGMIINVLLHVKTIYIRLYQVNFNILQRLCHAYMSSISSHSGAFLLSQITSLYTVCPSTLL